MDRLKEVGPNPTTSIPVLNSHPEVDFVGGTEVAVCDGSGDRTLEFSTELTSSLHQSEPMPDSNHRGFVSFRTVQKFGGVDGLHTKRLLYPQNNLKKNLIKIGSVFLHDPVSFGYVVCR